MTEFCIEGVVVTKDNPDFQPLLAAAYKAKHRPLCLCRAEGVPMYIAKLGDYYIVKRMPNSATSHHASCSIYELPAELTGMSALQDSAIAEDETTGITTLKLDFSLTKKPSKERTEVGGGEAATVKAKAPKMTLKAFLHYLYDTAGLNKYSADASKRNWAVVRRDLMESVAKLVSKNIPLVERALIPETFRLDEKDKIYARLNRFMGKLVANGPEKPIGILIGEVKGFQEARVGNKVVIKHLPDHPLYMDKNTFERFKAIYESTIDLWNERERYHLLTISTFSLSASQAMHPIEITLMLTDENWIPIEGPEEAALIEMLVREKREFIKPLRFNLKTSDLIASAILTDRGDQPHPIFMLPADPDEDLVQQYESIKETSGYESSLVEGGYFEDLHLSTDLAPIGMRKTAVTSGAGTEYTREREAVID